MQLSVWASEFVLKGRNFRFNVCMVSKSKLLCLLFINIIALKTPLRCRSVRPPKHWTAKWRTRTKQDNLIMFPAQHFSWVEYLLKNVIMWMSNIKFTVESQKILLQYFFLKWFDVKYQLRDSKPLDLAYMSMYKTV